METRDWIQRFEDKNGNGAAKTELTKEFKKIALDWYGANLEESTLEQMVAKVEQQTDTEQAIMALVEAFDAAFPSYPPGANFCDWVQPLD